MGTVAPSPTPGASVPPRWPATVAAAFQATVAASPDRVALRTPGDAVRVTWSEYDRLARDTAARLAALGVRRGDRVALLLSMRPDAAWVDAAALHLGAVGVSLYLAGTAASQAHVLADTGARVLVTERALAERATALLRECPAVEHVVGVDGDAPGVTPLGGVKPAGGFDFDAAWTAVRPQDPVTLMYTSGTTGPPKGTVYDQGTIVRVFERLEPVLPPTDDPSAIAYLPFAHAGQRAMVHYRGMLLGATTTFCADARELPAALADARPASLFAPPAVWELLAAAAQRAIGSGPPPDDADVLPGIRRRLGLDRMVQPFVSGAPCAADLLERLHALGVPVMNLYALTELPPIAVARPDVADIGTVGRPLPGVQVRLAGDGEILVRHPARSSGYHRRPEQTAALFGEDGWAHTGDLGTLDDAGRLRLVGRRDERLVTSLGANIDPFPIEQALAARTPAIAQACVLGHGRPYLVALVAVGGGGSRADVADAVARVNADLPEVARIRRHLMVGDPWDAEHGILTPTMKLRRGVIAERYASEIEALYAG